MKKTLLILLIAIMISFSTIAQSKNPEKSAKRTSDKITALLSLNSVDDNKVYKIQLEKIIRLNEIKEKHGNDNDAFKLAKKPINSDANKKLQGVIGKDGLKKWNNLFIIKI